MSAVETPPAETRAADARPAIARNPVDVRVSLQNALARSLTLVALLAVAVSLTVVLVTGFLLFKQYAHHNLELVAQQASYSLEVPVVFNDPVAAQETLAPIVADESIDEISVTMASGKVLTKWERPGRLSNSLLARLVYPDAIEAPVGPRGQRLASVRVMGGAQGLDRLLTGTILGALGCLVVTFIGTGMIGARLRRTIIEPIQSIAEVAQAVKSDRTFERRAPGAEIAEVDDLSRGFNALLDELQDWHQQLDRAHEALLHRASHDTLSGLPNRSAFVDAVGIAIRSAQRNGEQFAMLFLDGDRFKETNDRYGHVAGDRVIAAISARISEVLRFGDTAARMGGDEFAILIHHLDAPDDVQAVADRIRAAMLVPIEIGDSIAVSIGLSIGCAIYPDHGQDVEALIRYADEQMYLDKHSKNRTGPVAVPSSAAAPTQGDSR